MVRGQGCRNLQVLYWPFAPHYKSKGEQLIKKRLSFCSGAFHSGRQGIRRCSMPPLVLLRRYDLLCSVVLPLVLSCGGGMQLARGAHALYTMAAAN